MPQARLTLDLDEPLRREIKESAARAGISMKAFCVRAIERQLREEGGRRAEAWTTRIQEASRRILEANAGRSLEPFDVPAAIRAGRDDKQ